MRIHVLIDRKTFDELHISYHYTMEDAMVSFDRATQFVPVDQVYYTDSADKALRYKTYPRYLSAIIDTSYDPINVFPLKAHYCNILISIVKRYNRQKSIENIII